MRCQLERREYYADLVAVFICGLLILALLYIYSAAKDYKHAQEIERHNDWTAECAAKWPAMGEHYRNCMGEERT